MGLGTATTLSAAVNPDFGQVEQDPAVLNLSVFETFFPGEAPVLHRRQPVARAELSAGADVSFAPHRPAARIDSRCRTARRVIERPDATTILGATKVTGKANGWTYGGLTALTDREYALVETRDGRADRAADRAVHVVQRRRACRRTSSAARRTSAAIVHRRDARERLRCLHRRRWTTRCAGDRTSTTGTASGRHPQRHRRRDEERLRRRHQLQLQQQALRRLRALRLLQQRRSRTATSASSVSRNNKTQVERRLQRQQSRSGQGASAASTASTSYFTQYNGDWLPLDKSYFIGGDGQFLNYWNFFIGTGPLLADLRRSRHARRSADRQARRLVRRLVRRHRIRASASGFSADGALQRQQRRRATTAASTSASTSSRSRSCRRRISTGITDGHDVAQWIQNDGRHRRRRRRSRLRRARSQRRQRDRARHLRVHARHDARGLPAAVRGRRRLLRTSAGSRAAEVVRVRAGRRSTTIPTSTTSRCAATSCSAGSTAAAARCISSTTCRTATTSRPGEFSPFRDLRSGFGAAGTQVLMVKFNYWLGL